MWSNVLLWFLFEIFQGEFFVCTLPTSDHIIIQNTDTLAFYKNEAICLTSVLRMF